RERRRIRGGNLSVIPPSLPDTNRRHKEFAVNMRWEMRMRTRIRMIRQVLGLRQRSEEGIALVTTLVILLIMTVLGVGAVAVTALENRIAGFQRTGESATSAAEACVGTSANIIKQTIV